MDRFEKGKTLYKGGFVFPSYSSETMEFYFVQSKDKIYEVIVDKRTGRKHCDCDYFLPEDCSHAIAVGLYKDEPFKGGRGKGTDTGD